MQPLPSRRHGRQVSLREGIALDSDSDRVSARLIDPLERALVGEIVPKEQGPSPLERRFLHEGGYCACLGRASGSQLDHEPAALSLEVLAQRSRDVFHRLQEFRFERRHLSVVKRERELLVLEQHAGEAFRQRTQLPACTVERGLFRKRAAEVFARGIPALETVKPRRGKLHRMKELIERGDAAPAHERHRAIACADERAQEIAGLPIDGDGIGSAGKLKQRAVDVEEERQVAGGFVDSGRRVSVQNSASTSPMSRAFAG
jgi:hypothetical protein